MILVTLCLGNGPLKLTGLMGPWPRDNSCCLQVNPNACPGVLEWLGSSKDGSGKREGTGASSRRWGDSCRERQTESGHRWCQLLLQLHHWLARTSASTFPSLSFPTYKMEVMMIAPRYGHFYFLPPVAICLFSAPSLMLIWASTPIHYDTASTPHF